MLYASIMQPRCLPAINVLFTNMTANRLEQSCKSNMTIVLGLLLVHT